MKSPLRFLRDGALTVTSLFITAAILGGIFYVYVTLQLPDVDQLKDIHLQVPLRIYTHDGKLLSEFGEKRRIPVRLDEVPKPLVDGILATEDQRFYEHAGVDFIGLVRAAKAVLLSGRKVQGASTITMQVARNFFLSRKKTYGRKLNEILLAIKIDHALDKRKILELYLNKIYLGHRAYGVAAAAQAYYGKTLDQLTLPQMAMLAGLPQAPSRDNPIANPRAAQLRRNHVLERMHDLGYIDTATYNAAIAAPLTARYHGQHVALYAPYIAEMVRSALVAEYGESVYEDGFRVYTTIDSKQQAAAQQALRTGLMAYDRRHGYRRPEDNLGAPTEESVPLWQDRLQDVPIYNGVEPAAVLSVDDQGAQALLKNGQTIELPNAAFTWARRQLASGYLGKAPEQASDVVSPGDVIRVYQDAKGVWQFSQVPAAEGALVALNPQDGGISALVGGFSYTRSHFNRVMQAGRQPGSAFKPFIYAAALAQGYTLASLINDAPVVLANSGAEDNLWRPQNVTMKFYGPTRLRIGLIQSRNLVSIRLLQDVGLDYVLPYVERFGFRPETLPNTLSLALGTASVTPLELASGYATFANGGYRISPYFIDRIEDVSGNVIFQAKPAKVVKEDKNADQTNDETAAAPRIITPQVAYLINNALQDVIHHGTGRRALSLKRGDLSGKTGTTNKQMDAWFSGYNGDVVTTVWVGFDAPQSLREYGAQVALPIWIQFMGDALHGKAGNKLAEPDGLETVRIDPKTGLLAYPGQTDAIFEIFRADHVPHERAKQPRLLDTEQMDVTHHDATSELF